MFDPRNNLANEVSSQLIAHFGDKVFRTIVPRNVRLAEAPSFGKPVLQHDKDSRGALAYLALAGEMLRKEDEAANEPEVAPPARSSRATGDSRASAEGCSHGVWLHFPSAENGACPHSPPRLSSAAMSQKKPVMGRGLEALLGQMTQAARARARRGAPATPAPPAKLPGDELANLPLDLLQRGKYQPRVDMRQESLEELAASIKSQGIVQPIVVRAGRRRRAGRLAALRNHRRRTPLARRADRRPRHHARRHPPRAR